MITIISIIAASLTTLGFFYYIYRKINRFNNIFNNKIENVELFLKTKQQYTIPKNKFIILDNDKIIRLDRDEVIIIDDIDGFMVKGKIYNNTVNIRVNINDLGNEVV